MRGHLTPAATNNWWGRTDKVTTPEWVVDKPTKLTTIFDRIDLLRTRFALIRRSVELEFLETHFWQLYNRLI